MKFLLAAVAVTALAATTPDWLYPAPAGPREPHFAADAVVTAPGSTVTLRGRDLRAVERTVDWFPDPARPVPAIIRESGEPGRYACGFCHLGHGEGRPENASLAGLDAAYIVAQTEAFRSGARHAARDGWFPSQAMRTTIQHVRPEQVEEAARWFSQQKFVSRVTVVEAAAVPPTAPLGYILAVQPGQREPIAGRLIEVPDDIDAFERRDPRATFTAWVPPGSIARGRAIGAALGCMACHAELLNGWGPGRSPSYILRQLLAFKARTRAGPGAAPMHAVADQLDQPAMVAVAAWMAAGAKP